MSAQDKRMLFVPPGFAHGFEALEDQTKVSYSLTHEYSKESERRSDLERQIPGESSGR